MQTSPPSRASRKIIPLHQKQKAEFVEHGENARIVTGMGQKSAPTRQIDSGRAAWAQRLGRSGWRQITHDHGAPQAVHDRSKAGNPLCIGARKETTKFFQSGNNGASCLAKAMIHAGLGGQESGRFRNGNDRFGRSGHDAIAGMVPEVGLEPTSLSAADFESAASTNSTTRARAMR